jgi:hypothetical protein
MPRETSIVLAPSSRPGHYSSDFFNTLLRETSTVLATSSRPGHYRSDCSNSLPRETSTVLAPSIRTGYYRSDFFNPMPCETSIVLAPSCCLEATHLPSLPRGFASQLLQSCSALVQLGFLQIPISSIHQPPSDAPLPPDPGTIGRALSRNAFTPLRSPNHYRARRRIADMIELCAPSSASSRAATVTAHPAPAALGSLRPPRCAPSAPPIPTAPRIRSSPAHLPPPPAA